MFEMDQYEIVDDDGTALCLKCYAEAVASAERAEKAK